jgi:DNA-binding NarL/FixJ family response regulator
VPGIPIRILFVEDSTDDAEVILQHLRREGFAPEPRIVNTAEAFRAALDGFSWDVILSDFSMPRFDGLKAFDLLLARKMDIPFIFVSGHIDEDRAAEAMRRGVSDYVLKDHLARLVPAIQRELRARDQRAGLSSTGRGRQETPAARTGRCDSGGSLAGLASRLAGRPDDVPPSALSPRQREVLLLVAEGRTSKEIAAALGLAAKTAGAHRASLMQKLRIHTVVGLVRYAIRHGLIKPCPIDLPARSVPCAVPFVPAG